MSLGCAGGNATPSAGAPRARRCGRPRREESSADPRMMEAVALIAEAFVEDMLRPEREQRLQNIVFPGGLAYDPKEGYRTYTSSLFINKLCAELEEKSPMARPRRVELRLQG